MQYKSFYRKQNTNPAVNPAKKVNYILKQDQSLAAGMKVCSRFQAL
jgi:hypothetical protein